MAASGFTPILIYASGTASNVPLAANLTSSASGAELALNYADGKLYFKNSSGVVTLLAGSGGGGPAAGSNTQIQFNNSGVFGASANLTWSGTVLSTTGLTATGAITLNTTTNNQSYTTTGAGTITISSGTAGSINNMNIGGTTAAAGTFTSLTDSGNLTFTGTGNRIIGDFSNATAASRVAIQTSTTNGNTNLEVIPNGTATRTDLVLNNAADPTNASLAQMFISNAEMRLISNIRGTGTYLPMTFYTGGSERMRLDTSGNLGIGTSSPGVKLDVAGAIRSTNSNVYAGDGSAFAWGAASTYVGGSSSTNIMTFVTSSSERMRIDSSGNVGIGTSSPAYKLDVRGVIAGGNGTIIGGISYSTRPEIGAISNHPVGFITNNTTQMLIDTSGNVGIGTSSPAQKLDVVGSGKATSSFAVGDSSGNLSGSMVNESDVSKSITFNADPANVGTNSFMRWNVDGTERMRIDSSGNVGIGTSSPSYKLDVVGGIRVNLTGQAQIWNGATGVYTSYQYNGTTNGDIGTANQTFSGGATGDFGITSRAGNLVLGTNTTERMRIDSSGNVGIGTSSPGYKLDVASGDTTNGQAIRIRANATSASGGLQFTDSAASTQYGWIKGKSTGLSFFGGNNSAGDMFIDASGNVGIGVNNPTAKLQVAGQIRSTGVTGDYAAYFTQAGGADRDILVAGVSAVSNGLQVQYVSSAMKYTLTGLGSGTVSSSSGVLSASSDQNMKVADGEIENAINKVLALKPRYFYWKDKDGNADTAKRRQLGFYAQEVNVVVPEASPEPIEEHDGWGVYDRSLVATLTAAIQEQQALITSLTARIEALEAR